MNLTPNCRMAAFLGRIAQSEGRPTFPITVWLEQLYSELIAKNPTEWPSLLGAKEEEVVWEKIISRSEVGQSLLKTTGAAHLASEAWRLSVQWQSSVCDARDTPDTLAFQEWKQAYLDQCRANRWVDSASVVDLLSNAIGEGLLSLPQEIFLIGFEELTPQFTRFFDRIKNTGTLVHSRSLVFETGTVQCLAAKDPEQELRFAAHTAKQWLKENPQKRIGIVVPNLEQTRSQVVRIFEEVFPLSAFNVAAPIPLIRYPFIESAILALGFLKEISLEKFSRFLRSPFFGNYLQERSSKSRLDIILRGWGETHFSIERLISRLDKLQQLEQLKQSDHSKNARQNLDISTLLLCLHNFAKHRSSGRSKQSTNTWSELFKQLLKCLGWPGEQGDTCSVEITQQWDQLLEEYVCMGRVLGDHSYSAALSCLMRLASSTHFLPVSPPASIQILGVLEAVGIPFDSLWVTGLHREVWPSAPAPNPFIPLSIQRTQGLPRSSATRELAVAERFTERLCQGARRVIFSYPLMIEDRATAISPLLAHLPMIAPESLGLSKNIPSFLERIARIKIYSSKTDHEIALHKKNAPKVQDSEKIRGGAQVLKLQANCPFRAFAEIRLKAQPLPVLQPGLSGKERGQIIHEVLQVFWQDLSDRHALEALGEDALMLHITTAIDTVLAVWKAKRPKTLTPHYASIEHTRIFRLIHQFATLEKKRPYFKISMREKERVVELEGLELKMRIDRVDQLEDGKEILIDYKTGETSISSWFGERPRDPQLPLYCVTHESGSVEGVLFGVLRPGEVKFDGLAKQDVAPGVRTVEQAKRWGSEISWEAQYTAWQNTISVLAQDFKRGIADVDPLEGKNTCRYCSLKPLCRVQNK